MYKISRSWGCECLGSSPSPSQHRVDELGASGWLKTCVGRRQKNPKHSLLFGPENDKEILGDHCVETAVLMTMLNPSPNPHDSASTEVEAADVPEPARSSAAGAPRLYPDVH